MQKYFLLFQIFFILIWFTLMYKNKKKYEYIK